MKAVLRNMVMLLAMAACRVDDPVVPLPLQELRTFEIAPVRAKRLPDDNGFLLFCRRASSDPSLDFVQLMDRYGTLGARIGLGGLASRVENIDFLQEDIWITDALPTPDGGLVLLGMGLQRDLDDRLHLFMYELDGAGQEIGPPIRRFLCSGAEVNVPADLDQLYDAVVLGSLVGADEGRVAAIARYVRDGQVERRSFVLPRTGLGSSISAGAIAMASEDHVVQFMVTDPNMPEQVLLGYDTTGVGSSSALHVQRLDVSGPHPIMVEEGTITARNATATHVTMRDGQLLIAGHSDPDEPGVLRPFVGRVPALAFADQAVVFPGIRNGRSVVPYALDAGSNTSWIACTAYEQAVTTDELRRDDLFGDLLLAEVDGAGNVSNEQLIIPGQGLRPLAMRVEDGVTHLVGLLHPFLNVDLLHAFQLRTEGP